MRACLSHLCGHANLERLAGTVFQAGGQADLPDHQPPKEHRCWRLAFFAAVGCRVTAQRPTRWPLPRPQSEGMTSVLSGTKLGLWRSLPMKLQGQLLKPGNEIALAAQGLFLKGTALSWAHLQERVSFGNLQPRTVGFKKSWADRHFNFVARSTWLMTRTSPPGAAGHG